jgi:hypothetical protein
MGKNFRPDIKADQGEIILGGTNNENNESSNVGTFGVVRPLWLEYGKRIS